MADSMIPVLKDTKDPHYRYKMPKLTAKVEGSGNGIKTVLTNISAVAKSLYRPASYPTKYFGCELGAQVTMNNDIFIVNGSHDPEKLLNLLYSFIRKFVLCPKCNNPETSLTIEKGTIKQKCIACGHAGVIPKTIHKLTTYIINHPPEATTLSVNNTKERSTNKPSKNDKKAKKNGGSPTNGSNSPTHTREDSDELGADNNDDDFGEDEFSADAISERLREGFENGLVIDSRESANIFYESVKSKRDAGQLSDLIVQKELLKEAEQLDIKDKSLLIFSELLFTEKMFDEIEKHRILLIRFCNENKKAQKYLLGGYEKLVGDVYKDTLFNSSMKILKQFYDQDIIDEETIIEWANKDSKKYVSKEMNRKIREKVGPFIKWLKEAEEEEEDDEDEKPKQKHESKKQEASEEDEDEDNLIGFSHRVQGIQIESLENTNGKIEQISRPINGGGDVEDIDIDDI